MTSGYDVCAEAWDAYIRWLAEVRDRAFLEHLGDAATVDVDGKTVCSMNEKYWDELMAQEHF